MPIGKFPRIRVRRGSIARILLRPVQQPFRLVEIDGLGDVGGNAPVILSRLLDTIHLNGEQHRNSFLLQLARCGDGFRSAPAMPIKNNTCFAFFFCRERTVVIGIKQTMDLLTGLPDVICKNFDVYAGGIIPAQLRGELDFTMSGGVMPDESTDESDYDYRRRGDRVKIQKRKQQRDGGY